MIPEQVRQFPLIRVCHPDGCRVESHGDCSHEGKRPVTSTDNPRSTLEVKRWVESGGNYGVVAKTDNSLSIIDADCTEAIQLVEEIMPDTFAVESSPGSRHFYLKIPGYSHNESWKSGNDEFASIRSKNWHVVGPGSVHPETRAEYQVGHDTDISVVTGSKVSELEQAFSEAIDSREDGGGGAAAAAAAAPSSRSESSLTASDLQIEPTDETLSALGFINSDSIRQQVGKVIDHPNPPRSPRVWAGGWLHSAAGLTESQLNTLLRELADWATDNDRIRTEVRSLIQSSTDNPRANESVDLNYYLSTADMGPDGSERRKTESGDESAGYQGGDNNMSSNDFDYTSKENLTVYNADSPQEAEDGDRVVRAEVTNMKGHDENGEVDTDFVTISKGTLRHDGEFGVSPEFPQDNKSVGAADPDDLRLIADALNQLADDLE